MKKLILLTLIFCFAFTAYSQSVKTILKNSENFYDTKKEVEQYFDKKKRSGDFDKHKFDSDWHKYQRWEAYTIDRINLDGSYGNVMEQYNSMQKSKSKMKKRDGQSWYSINQTECTGGYSSLHFTPDLYSSYAKLSA